MNVEQIIKLIAAGYTKEDIEKMNQPAAEPAPAPEEKQPEYSYAQSLLNAPEWTYHRKNKAPFHPTVLQKHALLPYHRLHLFGYL